MMLPLQPDSKVSKTYWFVDRKNHFSSSSGPRCKMDRSEEDGGGGEGGGVHNKNAKEMERAEKGGVWVSVCVCVFGRRWGSNEETQRENQTGKIREAPVLCYSFSCSDITVRFPRGQRGGPNGGGGGREKRKPTKVEAESKATAALRGNFPGRLNLLGT